MKTLLELTYTNNYTRLVKYACSYVGNEVEAEDIVQDTFMHIWSKLSADRLEEVEVENIRYVTVVLKNKCIDFLRLKKRTGNVYYSGSDELDLLYDKRIHEDTVSKDIDLERLIHQAINNLPPKCRQIFIEKKLNGEKQKNIALKYNISIKTIEKQMNIAYKKLRNELNCYL
ncbi:MAG: sigma-70 family RNA polymerase sigma factor [Tannerella sp.]|jgi:RNA polymerase sigma-70 factor (ECF subfamily)|nr:sigma-70 family RNA polymerase sigma factor [Tannerella sp.]